MPSSRFDQPLYNDVTMMSFNSFQDKNGNVFIGKVWPGYTAFTDFMNFDTHSYWQDQVSQFRTGLSGHSRHVSPNHADSFFLATAAS